MDFNSIIAIVVGAVAIYLFIKFVVNPLIKTVLGIVIFLILIYILKHTFNLDLTKAFGPFGSYFDLDSWGSSIGWLLDPINYFLNKATSFFHYIWGNVPK
jgi:hypothetical protein